jgi:pyruvate,water dikinase
MLGRGATGGLIALAVPEEQQRTPVLSETERAALVELADRIETFFGMPQDVEWAIAGGELFVLQSRPITTLA